MDNIVHPMAFETRKPVIEQGFHDREEVIEQLRSLVEAHFDGRPSWLAVLGPRKIGKTSILRELCRRSASRGVIVTLDLFKVDSRIQDVFLALLRSLLVGICEQGGHHDLARQLAVHTLPFSARLVRETTSTLRFDSVSEALDLIDALCKPQVSNAEIAAVLELPEHVAQELGPVWIILDELQELYALNRQKPFNKRHTVFRLMRSVWQNHEHVSYWVTGSQVSMLTGLFTDRRSPFHGHFRLVHVGPFSLEAAATLLLERTPASRMSADAEEAAMLAVEALGGHPFYVQMLGEELDLRRTPLSKKGVKSVLQDILLTPTGRLALHLNGILEADAGSGQQLAVLRALARGDAKLSELTRSKSSLSKDATHTMLRRLQGADLVTQNRKTQVWRVVDPALAAYLRTAGLTAEPSPAVLGDEGEKAAARHLLSQGLRPVYQSYRSLGPADLVVLEGTYKLALQVKRAPVPIYVKEVDLQRLDGWAAEQCMTPLLCQVDPEEPSIVRYWRWSSGVKTKRMRRFDEAQSTSTVLELLKGASNGSDAP